jgi:hypothetical protein
MLNNRMFLINSALPSYACNIGSIWNLGDKQAPPLVIFEKTRNEAKL